MNVKSITHDPIKGTDNVLTTVIINQVSSQCILARLLIDVLGKPGIDNDMEMMGTGDTWTIMWTQPSVIVDQTSALITKVILKYKKRTPVIFLPKKRLIEINGR